MWLPKQMQPKTNQVSGITEKKMKRRSKQTRKTASESQVPILETRRFPDDGNTQRNSWKIYMAIPNICIHLKELNHFGLYFIKL